MALSSLLQLSQFFSRGIKPTVTLDLGENLSHETTNGGVILPSSNGPRLWEGGLTVWARSFSEANQAAGRARLLRTAGYSFLVTHPTRIAPRWDPDGAILGAATPTITAVNSNMRDITISGLTPAYQLSEEDLLEYTYLSGPTRYALHEVVSTATANGSGVVTVEVMPPLQPGYSLPTAVRLLQPRCKVVYVPGSYSPPVEDRLSPLSSFSLNFRQTYK